jgi:undecaprenyl phosphate-alpha-L-ara4N flippase subunit ArnE
MKLIYIVYLVCYTAALAVAQIFLKIAASGVKDTMSSFGVPAFVISLIHAWSFWVAILLCGILVFVWAWLLTIIPLQLAYPFVVLTIVFIGLFEHILYGEPLHYRFFIGSALIGAGLYFLSYGR